MTTSVLICDDSMLARRQLARILPQEWDVDVSYAHDGRAALAALREGRGEILFLDLNMPEMDGFGVLETIRNEALETRVVVVSGDIQPAARARVEELGALGFLRKPIAGDVLLEFLVSERIFDPNAASSGIAHVEIETRTAAGPPGDMDCFRELANIAMGRASELLARLLDVHVVQSIPRVNVLELGELKMALHAAQDESECSAVCQGFIGSRISGEALLLFHDSSFADLAELVGVNDELDETIEAELLVDIASVLIGAFVRAVAEQLDVAFSESHPVVLGRHVASVDILARDTWRWERTLAMEIPYEVEGRDVSCHLLVLFTEESLPAMRDWAALML